MASKNKTLTDYANSIDKDFFNLRKASKIEVFDGFEFLSAIIIENYLDILKENAEYVTLSDEEVKRFSYKPKALSKRLYDTENLYYVILLMNNMTVETFVPKNLYLLSSSNRTLIEDIINLEKKLKNI
jgi:Base plate wedge protein 53.